MKIDMSSEAVTNRLIMMEQLWELSVNLSQAQPLENGADEDFETALLSEKSLEKDWNNSRENRA